MLKMKKFVSSLLTKNWAIVLVVLCQKCFSLVLTFSAHIKKGVSVPICSHSILIKSNPRLVRLADWSHWQDPTTHRYLTVTRHQLLCFPQNTTAERETRSQCNWFLKKIDIGIYLHFMYLTISWNWLLTTCVVLNVCNAKRHKYLRFLCMSSWT